MKNRTPKTRRSSYHTFVFAGGVVGLLAFLAFGLLPSVVYGGFAGVTLAAAIFGHPLEASMIARAIVVFGTVVGLLATAAIFVVSGSALAAGLFSGVRALVHRDEAAEAEVEAKADKVS